MPISGTPCEKDFIHPYIFLKAVKAKAKVYVEFSRVIVNFLSLVGLVSVRTEPNIGLSIKVKSPRYGKIVKKLTIRNFPDQD